MVVAFIIATALYSFGLGDSWLFDDRPNLSENLSLQGVDQDFDSWRVASFSSGAGILRRPVSMFTFALQSKIAGGLRPADSKAVNLFFHLACAFLVFRLCSLLATHHPIIGGDARCGQLFIAVATLAWLFSASHVSTVLYPVQRMAQLSAFFILTGCVVFVRHRVRWANENVSLASAVAVFLWVAFLTLMATLSKENGLLLPWLLVAFEVVFFRGIINGGERKWLSVTARYLLALPPLAGAAWLAVHTDWLVTGYETRDFDLWERLLTQGRLLWHYLYWFVTPDARVLGFYHDDISLSISLYQPISTLLAWCAGGLSIVVAFLLRHRDSLPLLCISFFLISHSLESSVLPLELVFEHRNYLPSVGIAMFLGWVVASTIAWRQHLAPVVLTILFLWFAFPLFVRAACWKSEWLLANTLVENHPESPRSRHLLVNALLRERNQLILEGAQDRETEVRQLLVAARKELLRCYRTDHSDLSALTQLFEFDSRFFSGPLAAAKWVEPLLNAVKGNALDPSEVIAIAQLLRCVASAECEMSLSRVSVLEKALINDSTRAEQGYRAVLRFLGGR